MNIEHNYELLAERKDVCDFIDKEFGIDYEVDDNGDGTGSIVVFEMELGEFKAFMTYLRKSGFIK